jgi:dTDP-glucose 4,6-dehydratase
MRILVTGALGTVGRGLVAELSRRGHSVLGLDISHNFDEVGFSVKTDISPASYVRCDVGMHRQLDRVFKDLGPFDYVFHAAAEFGRWNGEDFYEQLWHTNVVGTKNVTTCQQEHGFRLIQFSSSEVYGDWPDLMVESIMDEYEVKQLNDYAMTKWVNEMQVRNSQVAAGVESVVIRLFNTYGPGEYYSPYRSVNCRFLYCALSGQPFTVYRGHTRTSTYLQDSVNTIANITENFRPGATYNIGGDAHHSIEELADVVIQVTGADRALIQYEESEAMTTKHKRVDVTKAIGDLGHTNSYTLEEGLRLTADWMKKVYDFG